MLNGSRRGCREKRRATSPHADDFPDEDISVEGLLAARPVIATAAGGLAEAVAGFPAAVTVDPSSPTQIADAVEQIVHDWPAWRRQALLDSGAAPRPGPVPPRRR